MSDDAYKRLARALDTLPNGFPETESGVEIKILKKIFTPEEADLCCELKVTLETAAQVAKRTGRPAKEVEELLNAMWERGEIVGLQLGGVSMFKMAPWIVGIYEFQLKRMDREFAELCEEYGRAWGGQFMKHGPQIMQVIPIEKQIPVKQESLTYQQVSHLIDNAQSFMVNECICKKKEGLLGRPCTKPTEVCLAMAPVPGIFDNHPWGGRVITREGAYELLAKAEEAGLVHLTSNVESGHHFICNCCGCCCGVLKTIKMGVPNVVNSHYYAEIDPDECAVCGVCADERCQVDAIRMEGDVYEVLKERCIGCGLCISTCPTSAIKLVHKDPVARISPPKDEDAWLEERARQRGRDFSQLK